MGDARETYPAVESAQVFVIPSYQWMVARAEAADSRIQTLLAFAATVTFAVTTLARNTASFQSAWFAAAIAIAALIAIIGMIARVSGALSLPNPQRFFEKWYHLSAFEFQKNALYFAGQHFQSNLTLVNRKSMAATVMTGLFLCEIACLVVWTIHT